jgi:hypothetical protein
MLARFWYVIAGKGNSKVAVAIGSVSSRESSVGVTNRVEVTVGWGARVFPERSTVRITVLTTFGAEGVTTTIRVVGVWVEIEEAALLIRFASWEMTGRRELGVKTELGVEVDIEVVRIDVLRVVASSAGACVPGVMKKFGEMLMGFEVQL